MTVKNRAAKQKRHARTCASKQGYDDRQAARDALFALCRNTAAIRSRFEIYRCLSCYRWHYGHHIR